MNGESALIRVAAVEHVYGEQSVLMGIDLTVDVGECVALVGENGSGKSTLLRLVVGREQPTTGAVYFGGRPIDGADPTVRARIATVMDVGAYDPELTVREHVRRVAVAHGLGADADVNADTDAAVDDALARHGLTHHADSLPDTLSSGHAHAMLLAAAFVRPHDLLVLDEPERRLDARARRELAARLVAHKERGTAILLATHNRELAGAVADRVFELDAGRLALVGNAPS